MTLQCIVQMLTIIHLMKVTDGSPMTVLPKLGLLVTTTEGCEGEDKFLSTEDHSATEDILTYEWVYSTRNVFINAANITLRQKTLCQKTSGGSEVNPSYHGKVEYCNTSGIQLKNISLNDSGYYKLQFLREKNEYKESQTIFLNVSEMQIKCKKCKWFKLVEDKACTKYSSSDISDLIGDTECSAFPLHTYSTNGDVIRWKDIFTSVIKGWILMWQRVVLMLMLPSTPTEQCKPVIISHSGNVLHCTTHCGHLDLQWIWNKTESVVGNQSVLPISCSWKNEVILCCPKGQALGCYKGSQYDLCTPTKPSSCIEKAPDKFDSNLLGLLTLVIIPVILVILCICFWNKIKSRITMCHNRKNKSTLSCPMNKQDGIQQATEEAVNLLKGKEEPDSTPTVEVVVEPGSALTEEVIEESNSIPTVELVEEPESTPTGVNGEQEVTPTVEVKEKSDSTPTHFFKIRTEEETTKHELIMKELQELRRKNICKICFTNKINMHFLPCRHVVTCADCGTHLQECPVCKTLIDERRIVLFE